MNKQDQYITIEFESITGSAFFTPDTQYELKVYSQLPVLESIHL